VAQFVLVVLISLYEVVLFLPESSTHLEIASAGVGFAIHCSVRQELLLVLGCKFDGLVMFWSDLNILRYDHI